MGVIRKEIFLEELPRLNGYGGKRIDWQKSLGKKVKFIYDDIMGEIEIINIDVKTRMLTIKYDDNEGFKINVAGFMKCALGKLLGKITNEFKIALGEHIKDDKRDLIIIDRKYITRKCNGHNSNEKYYEFLCNKCNTKHWMVENSIRNLKIGCPCCAGQVVVKGVNDIATINPEMVKYFQGGKEEAEQYTCNSTKKLIFKCPICGSFKKKATRIYSLNKQGFSCDVCSDGISFSEKVMIDFLKQLNVDYIREYSQSWSNKRYYDFYIPSLNAIIETHGEQHYEEQSKYSKFKRNLVEEQENDRLKKELALNNGVKHYIVIDCRESNLEWIKNSIVNSELGELFDLSNVDWVKCEEFALNSMVYEVGKYFSENPEMIPRELSEVFNVTDVTIRNWLKIATKIGICNYDPKKSNSIGGRKSWKTRRDKLNEYVS